MQEVYYSNRLESLYAALRDSLFSSDVSPFARRIIVVPSPAMKSWLMMQMSKDPQLGIAMGIDVITHLDQSIVRIGNLLDLPILQSPSALELSFAIEQEIQKVISSNLSHAEQQTWQPLIHYLKTERRLSPLCSTISSLFIQYGIYAGEMVKEWKKDDGWQQALWCRLFHTDCFTSPYQNLQKLPLSFPEKNNVQFHLFAFSHISKLYHDFFMNVANAIPVKTYVLSPCFAFWSDLLSTFQSQNLQLYWEKRGASLSQQQALEELLRDCNPLLANFGRLGRERAQQLEESHSETAESYTISAQSMKYDCYRELVTDEIVLEEAQCPLTLLEAIQTDMALLRNPDRSDPIKLENHDKSIQVHIASSKMREAQILFDLLLALIDNHSKDSSPISPADILVMAPNINTYAPYIRAVFEGSESPLEIQISDLEMPLQSSLVQGLMLIIDLAFSRWNASAFIQLLSHPAFQKRHGITTEEVGLIKEWIRLTDVRWGEDAAHRDELLKRNYCVNGMVEHSSIGTWEYCFGRLLSGLALNAKDCSLNPLDLLDATQGLLLGKWMQILRSLRSDLECLYDGSSKTVAEWELYLRCLCEGYLESTDNSEKEALYNLLHSFSQAGQKLNSSFPFATMRFHLMNLFSAPKNSYKEQALHAVRFCSLLPMRAIPAKVVVLMGMEEGAFPRQEPASSLDLSANSTKKDYSPSKTDYDRFLFLETILSARQYLLITYTGISQVDDKEIPPSLVINELLKYIKKAYVNIDCTYKHPTHAFDKSYFSAKSEFTSYSKLHYREAKAFYDAGKKKESGFFDSFAIPKQQQITQYIDLKDLIAFARNPIKTFCNKTLGIYLESAEKREVQDEEDFHLSALQNYIVQKNALEKPVEHILNNANQEGLLPIGPFKGTAIDRIQKEILQLKENLRSFDLQPKDLFTCHSSDQVSQVVYDPQQWQVPALKIPYKDGVVSIFGTVPEVSLEGLVARIKDDKVDVIKMWPQFLFLSCLIKTFELPIKNQLLMVKGSKAKSKQLFADPFPLMTQFLDYYFNGLENVSPLVPEWVSAFFDLEASALQEHMQDTLNNPFQPMHNEYLKWVTYDGTVIPDAEALLNHWKPWAKQVYGDLYTHWYT